MKSVITPSYSHQSYDLVFFMKKSIQSIHISFACILLALCASFLPAKQAQAGDVFQALETVCNTAQGLCGPGYIGIVDGCFKGSDELKCAVAIINVSSGGQVSQAKGQIDAIISCINDGLPIKATCNGYLSAAGVSGAQINEAYALINQCSSIDDVDDAIVCADSLLDSSIADDADLDIPSWVDSMFDVYVDLRDKDYWSLVYHVGATVACAVANYFSGVDVCAFLADIAEIAGEVVDAAKEVGGALNNAGEKIFTNQKKHIPVEQYFIENWLPNIDIFASNIVIQKNSAYWDANVGAIYTSCQNYFDGHTMSTGKANRACNDMRDGTNTSDNSFIDKGFSQLASRRGAIMILPNLVRPAALARINQLRSQGLFKSSPLPANLVSFDPWHNAPEVPGLEVLVYRQYGLSSQGTIADSQYNRTAKMVNEAWPLKSVGYVAYLTISSAPVATGTLNFPTSDAIAKAALNTGEAAIDFAGEIKTYIQKAQSERIKNADQIAVMNKGLQSDREKPLNDMLSLCKPKSSITCEQEVRERFAICDAKAKAYYDANASVIGDFDSSQGKIAYKQWGEITRICQAEVKQFVDALANGPKSKTIEKIDTSGANMSISEVQKNIRDARSGASTTPPTSGRTTGGNSTNGSLSDALKHNELNNNSLNNSTLNNVSNNPPTNSPLSAMNSTQNAVANGAYGQTSAAKNSGIGLSAPINDAVDIAALAQCKPFLGRKDELLCTNINALNACKAQVDKKQLRTCRIVGSQEVYPALR